VQLDGRSVLDVSILFAMIVYGLAALLFHALIEWLTARTPGDAPLVRRERRSGRITQSA
jgi:hypothetical protein